MARRHPCRTRPASRLAVVTRSVRRELASRGLDALVITSLPNILYLTNFTGSSAIVVLTADRLFFITDFRYVTVLGEARGTAHECPDLELVTVEGSYDATLAQLLAEQPLAPHRLRGGASHRRSLPLADGDARRRRTAGR